MSPWTFPIALNGASEEPIYLQITRAISQDIRRGRLAPGVPLPGSRTLAQALGVHRNTILAAFRELQSEGWIVASARTTRVAPQPPEAASGPTGAPTMRLGFHLEPPARRAWVRETLPPGTLVFNTGLPDLRLVPTELLARAVGRALRSRSALGYGDPKGDPKLRTALAALLSGVRGLAVEADRMVITGGSQQGLDLVARTLLRPGDRVAVEDPGYSPAWATLRMSGADLVPVPVDAGGLDVEALEAALSTGAIRALYCTPQHQFPTTVTLDPARRGRLLGLAARHRFAIIEDDYDFEFPFDGTTVLPLASMDAHGVVVYLGTLSKVVTPGLRMGFVTGPAPFVEALAACRHQADRQGNHLMERAIADLVVDGELQRHVRKMFRVYRARRTALADALLTHLGQVATFALPSGGMSLWVAIDPAIDLEAWIGRAREQGVRLESGTPFAFHGQPLHHLRMGFASLNEGEIEEGIRRMKAVL